MDAGSALSIVSMAATGLMTYFTVRQRLELNDTREQLNAVTKTVYLREKKAKQTRVQELPEYHEQPRLPNSTVTYALPSPQQARQNVQTRKAKYHEPTRGIRYHGEIREDTNDAAYDEEIYEETRAGRRRIEKYTY